MSVSAIYNYQFSSMLLVFFVIILTISQTQGEPRPRVNSIEQSDVQDGQTLQPSQGEDILHSSNNNNENIVLAKWKNNKISYEIANSPLDTTLTEKEVRETIREAVETWNNIEGVNLLVEEYNGVGKADITISFLPCYHGNSTGLDNDPNFDCRQTFAHAFYPPVGDIHLNNEMMWSDGKDNKPSLYSIVLHELGHSLGLGHSPNPDSVMNGNFSGARAFSRLSLHSDDIKEMLSSYPVIEDECRDDYYYPNTCPESYCQLEDFIQQCRLTCGLCDPTECKDTYVKCERQVYICNDYPTILRQSCRKTCGMCSECRAPNIAHGKIDPDRESYFSGDRVEFGCLSGYQLEGGSTGVCEEGTWSSIPECVEDKDCYDLLSTCSKKKLEGRCRTMKRKMMVRCRKTCEFC